MSAISNLEIWQKNQDNYIIDYEFVEKHIRSFPFIIVLFWAIEVDLVSEISNSGGKGSLQKLEHRIGISENKLHAIAQMLEEMELLEVSSENREISITELGKRLLSKENANEIISPYLKLYELIREALPEFEQNVKPKGNDIKLEWPPRSNKSANNFADFMSPTARYVALWLEKTVDFSLASKILDIGGGDGSIVSQILNNHTHLFADVVDLPATHSLFESNIKNWDTEGRLRFFPINFLHQELPDEKYDIVLFNRMLCDWNDKVVSNLLNQASKLVGENGCVIICEALKGKNERWDGDPWFIFWKTLIPGYWQYGPRSEKDWHSLANEAGLTIQEQAQCKMHPIAGTYTIKLVKQH
jgi:ubiquinone/menaquinone biosynthesis C-methylase UbiE/predicted transcriptional regulator